MPASPLCPRCAYDLSGEITRWGRECPLRGRCSECGLDFAWADILSDRLRPPGWSYEHARARWPLCMLRAWRVSANQPRCWRELRLEHRVVPRRLVLSLLLVAAILWIGLGVSSSLMLASWTRNWWGWRATTGGVAAAPTSPPSLVEIAWMEHKDVLFMPLVVRGASVLGVHRGPLIGAWMISLAVATVAMPLSFLLLPQTFRRTRVRRSHLLRAAAYTTVAPATLVLVGAGALAWWADERFFAFAWALTLLGVFWLLGAWRRIARDYLRLPQHRAVWFAMATIALLAGAVAGALMLPGELHYYPWTWRL